MEVKAKQKVSLEVAIKEVGSWLDFKKVSDKVRETKQDDIEKLTDAITEGWLSLDPTTNVFTQVLKFPFQEELEIKELKFKSRITVENVQSHLNGVKATDLMGMMIGYAAALTGQNKAIIKKMDSTDLSIATAISSFFF